jgi:hypothetical protein
MKIDDQTPLSLSEACAKVYLYPFFLGSVLSDERLYFTFKLKASDLVWQ